MRVIWILLLAMAAPLAIAGDLIAVRDSPNQRCTPGECGMYDEWWVAGVPGLRIVMSGYEDGVDTSFYRVDRSGKYIRLVDIVPLARDRSGRDWWGYADVVRALPLRIRANRIQVLATYQHDQARDGVHCPPDWQQRWPVVLFRGEKNRWNVEQRRYAYRWIDLDELVRMASRTPDDPALRAVNSCR